MFASAAHQQELDADAEGYRGVKNRQLCDTDLTCSGLLFNSTSALSSSLARSAVESCSSTFGRSRSCRIGNHLLMLL